MRVATLVVAVGLASATVLARHIDKRNDAARQRHAIYDEAWWYVG